MHALITADTVGGVWTYVRELVTGLCRSGVRVTLVSFGNIPEVEQTTWLESLENVDYRPTAFRLEWMQDAEADVEESTKYLASVVDEIRPDVLHLNQYCYGALAVDVPRVVVAHSDVVSWWCAVHKEEPPDSEWMRWYRRTVKAGLSAAEVVVAPSQWMMQAIRAHYPVPKNSKVIHNGRNRNLFNPHITKEKFAASVGRLWDAGKQVSLLNQIASPVLVKVAGASSHPESASCGEGTKGSDHVQFLGHQNEAQLRGMMARAAMYVATSRYEPFGLALVEAALSRCAIVANDIPSFRELWGDSVAYFKANDAKSLEEVMTRLSENDGERTSYANLAYEHARQHFSTEKMTEEYLRLYRMLVGAEATAA